MVMTSQRSDATAVDAPVTESTSRLATEPSASPRILARSMKLRSPSTRRRARFAIRPRRSGAAARSNDDSAARTRLTR